jgi:low temperature requirement protein LtrA
MSFRPIFGKPHLTQDWGEEQHERETHWTSLFYDLMIVAALNAIAEPFEEFEEENGESEDSPFVLLQPIRHLWLNALLQFLSVLNPWNGLSEYTAIFEDESFMGHICFFIHCFGLASTAAGCVGSLQENYQTLAIGIIITRIGLLILYARPFWYIPRTRIQSAYRCSCFVVVILLMLWGVTLDFERFRVVLIAACIWDWMSLLLMVFLKKDQRVPLHIKHYTDRQKEVTMVIFGEAIFAVTLQSKSRASPTSHFYISLASTLWLVYSLALQEFHILPDTDDHALRRSFFFGLSWYYTQFLKQIFLLGASIGLKRAHLLTFVSPDSPIDDDTYNLMIWGISMTLFSVVLIRSYSFGYGRHPSKNDPKPVWTIKVIWWTALSVMCLGPQLVGNTIIAIYPRPLSSLVALGGMMAVIIVFEALVSNLAVICNQNYIAQLCTADAEAMVEELTYLKHSFHRDADTTDQQNATTSDVLNEQLRFLKCREPKENIDNGSS